MLVHHHDTFAVNLPAIMICEVWRHTSPLFRTVIGDASRSWNITHPCQQLISIASPLAFHAGHLALVPYECCRSASNQLQILRLYTHRQKERHVPSSDKESYGQDACATTCIPKGPACLCTHKHIDRLTKGYKQPGPERCTVKDIWFDTWACTVQHLHDIQCFRNVLLLSKVMFLVLNH